MGQVVLMDDYTCHIYIYLHAKAGGRGSTYPLL